MAWPNAAHIRLLPPLHDMTWACLLHPPLHQDFYEDVFEEMAKFGEIENLNVCDNLADHMVGNVYMKFRDEESAARALAVSWVLWA